MWFTQRVLTKLGRLNLCEQSWALDLTMINNWSELFNVSMQRNSTKNFNFRNKYILYFKQLIFEPLIFQVLIHTGLLVWHVKGYIFVHLNNSSIRGVMIKTIDLILRTITLVWSEARSMFVPYSSNLLAIQGGQACLQFIP